jgi:hypothetical protein
MKVADVSDLMSRLGQFSFCIQLNATKMLKGVKMQA